MITRNKILYLKVSRLRLLCNVNKNRIRNMLLLDFNQIVEINELSFGKVYSNYSIQVFDRNSQLVSKGTEEEDSVSPEMIDTRISILIDSSFSL